MTPALGYAVPVFVYAAFVWIRGELRAEHLALLLLVVTMALASARSRDLLRGLFPFALVGVLFDALRPLKNVGLSPERVLGCALRDVDARFFGFASGGVRHSVHDFFLAHTSPVLDVLSAIPYATFILWCVGAGALLYVRDRRALGRFAWGFFGLNVAAFVTYHLVPAAPPWYVHTHGCTIDLATKASEGAALARVDALLGVRWFAGMYGKASSVFGALPSLHCAYPMLVVLEGWRVFGWRLRVASIAYWVAMVFAALYLDHHWVVDAVLGTAFAFATFGAVRLFERIEWRQRVGART